MKKLLKQILSELQGIRKALEPEVTPEPVNYSGQNNDVCNQVHSSSADQKPKVTTGTATRQGGCSAFTYEEPLSDKQEDEIMKEVRKNMTAQKPKLPESWHRDLLPGKEAYMSPYAYLPPDIQEAFDAKVKLYHLRQAYWQAEGWEPDYTVNKAKDTIEFQGNRIVLSHTISLHRFLCFKRNTGQAKHFLQHHRALIEQARELL